ncbi:MAG: sigma-70 family RNA polymerase sigma factor [Chitinivibrionales bacterium]|nr:sigma-70 family RNA polymerase sigma factor [Chitinivibrionales bacterium]
MVASENQLPDFRALVFHYKGYVYNLAYRILGNSDDAGDAVQETFLKLYKNRNNYNKQKNIKNWICTIAINASKDIYRQKKRRKTWELFDDTKMPDGGSAPEEGMSDKLFISEILNALSLNQRTAMVLFYIERKTIKDISSIMKRPEPLIKVWLFRSRKLLLEKFGHAFA